jgi:hypothetical protein
VLWHKVESGQQTNKVHDFSALAQGGQQTNQENDSSANNNINAFFSLHSSAAIITGVMTCITPRQHHLAELEEDICWFQEQEFKLLCDDDPLDDLDLLLEANLKDRYITTCAHNVFLLAKEHTAVGTHGRSSKKI